MTSIEVEGKELGTRFIVSTENTFELPFLISKTDYNFMANAVYPPPAVPKTSGVINASD